MRRVDPVDLALAPVGGWGPTLGAGHMDPVEAAEAVDRVGAAWAVPVHWGTFWPVGLRRVDRRRHEHFFVTPGQRFADAVGEAGRASGPSGYRCRRSGSRILRRSGLGSASWAAVLGSA